mmetsp:Transcript_5013/g.13324  ORF Transcript_5013/g.13324 Transcript_5013/m.13324 type:complete len:218 (+) Transcript_5013:2022-2675(+)
MLHPILLLHNPIRRLRRRTRRRLSSFSPTHRGSPLKSLQARSEAFLLRYIHTGGVRRLCGDSRCSRRLGNGGGCCSCNSRLARNSWRSEDGCSVLRHTLVLLVLQRQHSINSILQCVCSHFRLNLRLHANVVDDAIVGVTKCRDEELVPERCSICLVVQDARRAVRSRGNRFADDIHVLRVGPRTLEEAAVASEHLLLRVASELVESRRRENDGVVW